MSKKQKRVSPFWKDYKQFWEDQPDTRGPDPRIRGVTFTVYSSDTKDDISDAFPPEPDFSLEDIKTIKEALKVYHSRVMRPETHSCDLMAHVEYGGYWSRMHMVHPRYNESWIYIARWRSDTVCMEAYTLNPMCFAERSNIKANELQENNKKQEGLLEFWKKHPLNNEKE